MIFVGVDWCEAHHDVCVLDEDGEQIAGMRIAEGVDGVAMLHETLADHADEPEGVIVGIETDRGLLVGALVAAGYRVYAINPMSVDRYRDRHATSGAKSDPGDAKVLADLVRTDRHNHREVAGDSDLAEAIKLLARTHQSFVRERQRHVNRLRSVLREYYPQVLQAFGTGLASPDATSVLKIAPTPELGRRLSRSKIASALRRGGRVRNVETRAAQIQQALRSKQLEASGGMAAAYGTVVSTYVRLIEGLNGQIAGLERELERSSEQHPSAEILRSLPGLGIVLGARVLGEFGDDPTRYADARARRNYAGTRRSPRPPAPGAWSSPASHATSGCSMPASCGRSPASAPQRVPAATTTCIAPGARRTTKRCGPSRTDWSESCTAASRAVGSTTRRSPGPLRKPMRLDTLEAWDI